MSVYVLVAVDEDYKVRECIVMSDVNEAWKLYQKLREIWGGHNVALAARKVDDVPSNVSSHESKKPVKEAPFVPKLSIDGLLHG